MKVPEYVVKVSGARKETSSNVATKDATEDENDSEEISEASENDSASDSDVTVFENVAALHRRPWPAKVTVTVKLPAVASASALRVEMTDAAVSVATKKTSRRDVKKMSDASDAYALEVVLPFPVDDDDAGVVFDSRARALTVVAPVRAYTAARARAHAAFLRRAARKRREAPSGDEAPSPSRVRSRVVRLGSGRDIGSRLGVGLGRNAAGLKPGGDPKREARGGHGGNGARREPDQSAGARSASRVIILEFVRRMPLEANYCVHRKSAQGASRLPKP